MFGFGNSKKIEEEIGSLKDTISQIKSSTKKLKIDEEVRSFKDDVSLGGNVELTIEDEMFNTKIDILLESEYELYDNVSYIPMLAFGPVRYLRFRKKKPKRKPRPKAKPKVKKANKKVTKRK